MKTFICFLTVAVIASLALNVVALHKIRHEHDRVSDLQDYTRQINTNLMAVNYVVYQRLGQETNLAALNAIAELLGSLTNSSQVPVNPATGLPYGAPDSSLVDPATGLPQESEPVVLNITGRVTESNELWWRWAFAFSIGNPAPYPVTKNAEVRFLDKDGYIVATENEYRLKVSAFSTNRFSGFQLVHLPGASSVKSISVILD